MSITLALAALAIISTDAPHPPIIREGCQGESCSDGGVWIVTAPIELYAKPNTSKRIATLRKGTRLTALGGLVITTRVGTGVLTKPYEDLDSTGRGTRLKAGTRIIILSEVGEGAVEARASDGHELTPDKDEVDVLSEWSADDWVRVRLPNGRTGWIRHDYDRLDCSSIHDDLERCKALGAGPE